MNTESELARAYLARIAARWTTLFASGVLQREVRVEGIIGDQLGALYRGLLSWSRHVEAARRLFEEVVPAATQHPGRLFHRYLSVDRGCVRGGVHWPKTIQRRLGREETASLEFVSRGSERSLFAPENILLVATIEEVADDIVQSLDWISRLELASTDDARLLRTYQEAATKVFSDTALGRVRARHALRLAPAAIAKLEHAVRDRTRAVPPAAPNWSGPLLELRRRRATVPRRFVGARFDESVLWVAMATLDAIALIRSRWPVRQVSNGPSGRFRSPRGSMEPIDGGWLLLNEPHVRVGLFLDSRREFSLVRSEAVARIWNQQGVVHGVDRWLILHRATQEIGPKIEVRGQLQLAFASLNATESPVKDLETLLNAWL